MNQIKTGIIYTIIIFFISAMPLMAEFLFLKDGSIIKGTIINETAQGITFRNEQNNVTMYPHNNIMRVLYTELNMGKIYVQMKTGKNFRGYMVDEDQKSYTFRNEIYNPQEFVVKRSDVLFMAERNPSGLTGESRHTNIVLNWFPPYDKMKFYNIYVKGEKDKFELVDTSVSNTYNLKGLKSYTKYSIRVTGVDDTRTETLPSNELNILTSARVDVKLKNGKEFSTNLVADDWDKYTFRNNLDKTEEFNAKRTDVLYITERFPSRLSGEGRYTDISLKWAQPYDRVNHYNIYLKKNTDANYKIADTTGFNSINLSGVDSNAKYSIKVTGVYDNKTETPSSEEIIVSTLNRPPFKPENLKLTQMKTGETIIEWKPSRDPDGTVIKYKVYKVIKNKTEPAGEINATAFQITGEKGIERILVSAVDNNGSESDTASKRLNQDDSFSFTFTPGIMLPIDTFAGMFDAGYGGNISFMWQNLFVQGYALGFELGYYYFPGRKGTIRISGQQIHWMHLATAAVKTGYVHKFNSFLFITGTVSVGAAYMDTSYTASDYQTLVQTEKVSRGVDPLATLGVSLDFMLSSNFFLGINAGYGLFFETKAAYQFFTFGVNIGARF